MKLKTPHVHLPPRHPQQRRSLRPPFQQALLRESRTRLTARKHTDPTAQCLRTRLPSQGLLTLPSPAADYTFQQFSGPRPRVEAPLV